MNVLIIDRNEISAHGLRSIISDNLEEGVTTAVALSGMSAVGLLRKDRFDIVICDVRVDDMACDDLLAAIYAHNKCAVVVAKLGHDKRLAVSDRMAKSLPHRIFADSSVSEICSLISSCACATASDSDADGSCRGEVKCCGTKCYDDGGLGLSNAEVNVLRCMARGMKSKDIAKELFVSINTINTHRQHLLDKFGVHNAVDLIVKAIAKGIIKV